MLEVEKRNVFRNKSLTAEYLQVHPCVDCGFDDIRALDFDHVKGKKIANVGTMLGTAYSWDKIYQEILKCEVVCANCHRIRTSTRGNHFRSQFTQGLLAQSEER